MFQNYQPYSLFYLQIFTFLCSMLLLINLLNYKSYPCYSRVAAQLSGYKRPFNLILSFEHMRPAVVSAVRWFGNVL